MRACSINIMSVSDIHLGHPRTPTQHIADNFRIAFPDNAETAKLDLLNIAGDLWDRLMQLPEDEVYIARSLLVYILLICEKYDIILRILEGTPRHDRKQSKMVQELVDMLGLKLDYKYMDGCQIEWIERLQIHVLYIEDEYRHDPAETLAEVKRLMSERMITQVDFASMHGQFEHQLPDVENARRKCHVAREYLALVRYAIFIGHDHHYSEFTLPEFTSIILAHGSFDRTAQGEEEPKGHIRLLLDRKGNMHRTFVENKLAQDYRTLEVHGQSTDEVMATINALNLRPGSYIRLKASIFDMGIRMIRHLRKDFPQYRIEPLPDKEKKREAVAITINKHYTPIQISHQNVGGMAADWMARQGVSAAEIKDCEEYLNEQVNASLGIKGTRPVSNQHGDQPSH